MKTTERTHVFECAKCGEEWTWTKETEFATRNDIRVHLRTHA